MFTPFGDRVEPISSMGLKSQRVLQPELSVVYSLEGTQRHQISLKFKSRKHLERKKLILVAGSSFTTQTKNDWRLGWKLRLFLAAPLFSEAERDFNLRVARELREEGFQVWLAQEHKFVEHKSIEAKRAIFKEDLEALARADLVLAVLDGVDVDTGVAFEMGYAHALGKHILGLKTDHRSFSKLETVNLMLEVPVRRICQSVAEASKSIREIELKGKRKRTAPN
jgi:nucleoside 2-deoxyribosyltransferase